MCSTYRETYDDAFRDICELWDPDFSPIPAPVSNHYKPLPHTVGDIYRALHPL